MTIKYGIISEYKPGYGKVFFKEDTLVTKWWPILMRTSLKDLESWPLNVNEHVVCVTDQYCEDGVILGAFHSIPEPADPGAGAGKFRKTFEDGTVIEYDKTAHKLTADIKGSIDAKAVTTINIEAPIVTINGNLTVNGVVAAGGISASAMSGVPGADGKIMADADIETTGQIKAVDVKAGTVSLKNHTHGGVQSGGGTTSPPL